MTAFVSWWLYVYTRGLAEALRDERRAEVESDIWEQQAAGGSGSAILARCLAGLPADVSWRLEHSQLDAPGRLAAVVLAVVERGTRWLVERGLPRLTTLLAALYLFVGALVLATMHANENRPMNELAWFAGWCLVSGAMVAAGSRRIRTHRKSGSFLVVAGALPVALALKVTVVIPAAAAIVVAFELMRAGRQAHPRPRAS